MSDRSSEPQEGAQRNTTSEQAFFGRRDVVPEDPALTSLKPQSSPGVAAPQDFLPKRQTEITPNPLPPQTAPMRLEKARAQVLKRLQKDYPDLSVDLLEDAVSDAIAQTLADNLPWTTDDELTRCLTRRSIWNLHHRLRDMSRFVPEDLLPPLPSSDRPSDLESRLDLQSILSDSKLLSQMSRAVLDLTRFGFKVWEIAIRLHIKAATVRKKRERAIKKLREIFLAKVRPRGRKV